MEELCNQNREIIFSCLENIIQEGIGFGKEPYPRKYIEQAEDFFGENIRAINSIINKEVPYSFSCINIKNMLEVLGHHLTEDGIQQRRQLKKAVLEFEKYTNRLRELEDSPRRFYQSEEKKRDLIYICKMMKGYFQSLIEKEYLSKLETSDD